FVAGLPDLFGNAMVAGTTLDFFVLAGDTNRDGKITLDDFAQLDASWLKVQGGDPNTGFTWLQGDFDYDGQITLNDYAILNNAYATHPNGLAQNRLAAAAPTHAPVGVVGSLGAIPQIVPWAAAVTAGTSNLPMVSANTAPVLALRTSSPSAGKEAQVDAPARPAQILAEPLLPAKFLTALGDQGTETSGSESRHRAWTILAKSPRKPTPPFVTTSLV
ncbi:MAG: dockerin type I domain-containing protein, partial [Phycisphaerae bacterium]